MNGEEDYLCGFLRNYVKENFENNTYNKVNFFFQIPKFKTYFLLGNFV